MKYLVALLVIFIIIPNVFAQTIAENAEEALNKAREDMLEMAGLGFSIEYVNDTLQKAEKAMEEGNYELVIENAKKIAERKEDALRIRDSLRALALRITEVKNLGLNTSRAEEYFEKAERSFQRENYDEAEDWIFQANKYLYDVEAEYTLLRARYDAAKENISVFLSENGGKIILALIIVSTITLVSYRYIRRERSEKKLKDLELEKEVIKEMIKKTQEKYFKKGEISRNSYEARIKKYRERLREIEEEVPILKKQLGLA
jgi:tetratricopeptide (TPR) repeat protein